MYSYGAAASTDRALGQLRSGTLIPIFGAAFTNNTGSTITNLAISYTGEEWRLGTAARADRLDFQYSTNATDLVTGTYVDVDALDFSTPNQTTAGAKDGNVTGNRTLISWTITGLSIAPGATFWIRFNDIDATGADDGLAIDDFSITPQAVPPVNLAINDVSLNEGNAGTTSYTFSVSLSAPAPPGGVTFDIATADGTATAPGDYTAKSLTGQTIPAGSSTYAFTVLGNGDTTPETDETFFVNVSNVTGAGAAVTDGQGQGTIVNDDAAPTLTINDVSLNEGNAGTTTYTFTVNLSAPAPAGGVTFDIATANSTAIEPGDYTAKSLTGQTIPAGSSTYTFDVLVNGDTTPEADETFFVNVTNATNTIVTDGQGQGTIVNDEFSQIHDVQGNGATTPVPGATLTIEGIVTRTFSGSTALNGFYIQEEDADADADPNTSEGVFIYDPSGYFTGTSGTKVRVTGTVSEFASSAKGNNSSLTQITLSSAANVVTVSTGNPLPTAVNVTLPVTAVSDLEKYEGMLVTMSAASGNLTVTEYFELGRFGQVLLSATGATDQPGTDPRLDQYTQFFAPSVAGYSAYLAEIAKRRIYLDDGRTGQNPDPIIFGRGGNPLSATNTLRGGDNVASITAILDERSEGYRLQTNTGVDFQPANPRPATPPVVGGTLKAGSFNVLNYFNDLGTSNFTNCSGNAIGRRGANNATEFARQRDKIINAIITSGVDVMGLNEMENNGFGATSAIQDLINGLNAVAGANSFTYVNSGCISTDAITVAMIYKPAKVTPVGSSTAIPFSYGTGSFTSVGRRALAQTFQDNTTNGIFTLVANHWKSKGSGSGAGDTDAGDGQSASNGTRTRQAQDLVSWLATNPTGTTDPDYLIVGDLNAYAKEDPLTTLESGGYTNLVPPTTYSYVFDGFVGALDHALRSSSLQSQVAGTDKWHINSDEPSVLDYNTEFKTAGQIASLYNPEPFRASDHDPVIVGLNLTPATTPLALTFTASPTMLTTSGTTTLSATVSGGTTPYSYTFSGPGTISQVPNSNTATASGIPAGVQTFTVVASDATSQTISGTVSVTVTQANTPPTVANPVSPQSATVGVAYTLSLANVFTDAETPNSLTLSVSSLPAGLSFTAPSTISGTPSMSGVTSVTVTATDPGSLTASNTFTITVSPAPVVVTPLALTFTASPNMILTSGTTTLSATVSGGTTPYSYTFSGPGTINQSSGSNTATVSNIPAGVQTFTVVASDATSPTSQSISGTVSVTVTQAPPANTPPVATSNANQTAAVGQVFSYTVNAFTDAETPNGLTYTASINPANGLSFDPGTRVISGTPSMSGVSSVTVTATDPGSLSASTSFTITVSPAPTPPPTATFSITGVTTVSCEAISAGQRRVSFNPRYAGLNGTPVSFSVVNEMLPTTNPGPYTLNLYTDNPVITLSATQSGATTLFAYNWLSACSSSTGNTPPTVANPVPPQSATVGIAYTLSLAGVFTDAETPNSLVLSVMGLPAGLNFVAPSTISGTPSMSGVSTVTVTATDPGSMSASTSFTITVNPAAGTPPPPTGTFSITSVQTISCQVLSAGQRRLTFNPQYAGTNGAPISFSVVNEMTPTTNPGPYSLDLYTDNPVVTLQAVQSGIASSFAYNWLAACSSSTANTPPTVANPVSPQSATVGMAYTLSLAGVFTDAETPNQLTLMVSGLPAGLSFTAPSTISGTPSMSGVSTVTVTATDPGSMNASTSFTLTVSPAGGTPPPTGTFSITGVQTVSCQVISAGQRQVSFTPQYAGVNGAPISFSVVNEMLPTTNPGPYTLNLYTDNPTITLSAVQSGVSSTFAYNWLAACTPSAPSARVSAEPVAGLQLQVLGNPARDVVSILVTGAAGGSLNLTLTDGQGRVVGQQAMEQATASERVEFRVNHLPSGVLILRANTPTQSQLVKVIKAD